MTVWKYMLLTFSNEIIVPVGARVLSVQAQNGLPTLWVLVDLTEARRETWRVDLFGTGHPVPSPGIGEYLGTVQMPSALVWHVFKKLL